MPVIGDVECRQAHLHYTAILNALKSKYVIIFLRQGKTGIILNRAKRGGKFCLNLKMRVIFAQM